MIDGKVWYESNASTNYSVPFEGFKIIKNPELSEWNCHLFGSSGQGISYRPVKGQVPNAFVRWMMKICFACTWVKDK